MNTDYAPILNLLLAYEQQETLSMDEFDALEHFQQAGYRLWVSPEFDNMLNAPCLPASYGCVEQELPSGRHVFYVLVKDGE